MNILRRVEVDGKVRWVSLDKASQIPAPRKDTPNQYRLRWETRDPGTGQRRYEYETHVGTDRSATRRGLQREAEIRAQGPTYRTPSKRMLRDHIAEWLRAVEPELGPATFRSYSDLSRLYILPHLGAIHISELSAPMIQEWITSLRQQGLGQRTVSLARGTLHVALGHAVRLGLLQQNPVDQTRVPRARGDERRHIDALPTDQAEQLLAAAYARTRWGPFLEFQWLSGLRPSEALGLLWEDVDLERGAVRIRRSRVKVGGAMVSQEKTKTEAGMREVVLPARAVEALRRRRTQLAEDRLAAGPAYRDQGLVFQGRTGSGVRTDTVEHTLRRLLESLGLPNYRPYDLRHTAASMQIAAGVPIEVVSKRLGHRNISITVDTYGHLLPEANRDAARRVDEFLGRPRDLGHRGTKTPRNPG